MSLIRQDSTSDYSNMSEPGKLEIDASPVPVSKATPAKGGDGSEVSNVWVVPVFCYPIMIPLFGPDAG